MASNTVADPIKQKILTIYSGYSFHLTKESFSRFRSELQYQYMYRARICSLPLFMHKTLFTLSSFLWVSFSPPHFFICFVLVRWHLYVFYVFTRHIMHIRSSSVLLFNDALTSQTKLLPLSPSFSSIYYSLCHSSNRLLLILMYYLRVLCKYTAHALRIGSSGAPQFGCSHLFVDAVWSGYYMLIDASPFLFYSITSSSFSLWKTCLDDTVDTLLSTTK